MWNDPISLLKAPACQCNNFASESFVNSVFHRNAQIVLQIQDSLIKVQKSRSSQRYVYLGFADRSLGLVTSHGYHTMRCLSTRLPRFVTSHGYRSMRFCIETTVLGRLINRSYTWGQVWLYRCHDVSRSTMIKHYLYRFPADRVI